MTGAKLCLVGFAVADEDGKADLIIQLLKNLIEASEAVFITDTGGLLDGDGGFQEPLKKVLSRMQPQNRPTVSECLRATAVAA